MTDMQTIFINHLIKEQKKRDAEMNKMYKKLCCLLKKTNELESYHNRLFK